MVDFVTLECDGRSCALEYVWLNPTKDTEAQPLVFLHEGLGSIALWRQFPAQLCAALGRRGLVFSRAGYGGSSPWSDAAAMLSSQAFPRDYLEREAGKSLPALLSALQVDTPWLIGHSDGGSIALLAAADPALALSGIVTIAPHYCVEEKCLDGIRRAKLAYEQGGLRAKLARYHPRVDAVFYGWCEAWLDPERRNWNIEAKLAGITAPVLALQGVEDEYATLDQIEAIARSAPQTELAALDDCGHFPFLSKSEATVAIIADFIRRGEEKKKTAATQNFC